MIENNGIRAILENAGCPEASKKRRRHAVIENNDIRAILENAGCPEAS